jgi:PIN domain nuclease of toxin-antitoxin system
MRLLLDTHVLVWLAEGCEELPRPARELIDRAAANDGVAVSAISFWEVAMLAQRGRISLSAPVAAWREHVIDQPGIVELPVGGEVAIEAVQLPGQLHADPADRFLVASARVHRLRLATRDRRLLAYGAAGHVAATEV